MAKKKSVNPAKNAALSDSENKAVKVDELGNKVSEAPVHVSEINVDDYSVEERWKLPRKLWTPEMWNQESIVRTARGRKSITPKIDKNGFLVSPLVPPRSRGKSAYQTYLSSIVKSDGVKNGKVLSKTSRTGNDSDVSEKKKRFSASGSSPVKKKRLFGTKKRSQGQSDGESFGIWTRVISVVAVLALVVVPVLSVIGWIGGW